MSFINYCNCYLIVESSGHRIYTCCSCLVVHILVWTIMEYWLVLNLSWNIFFYRNVVYIHNGLKSRLLSYSSRHMEFYKKSDHDIRTLILILRILEIFLESAPQLVLQIYIILTETNNDGQINSRHIIYQLQFRILDESSKQTKCFIIRTVTMFN